MKWLSVILSCYLLGLTMITCTDPYDSTKTPEHTEIISLTKDHVHESEKYDDCSPLCACHCCQINITITEFLQDKPYQNLIPILPKYHNSFKGLNDFEFFIPPRV